MGQTMQIASPTAKINASDCAADLFACIDLGIVTPMANERENAQEFVRQVFARASRFSFRSIRHYCVFDNVCTDGTYEILIRLADELPHLVPVWAPENRCVVDAYLKGYHRALTEQCHWILEMDAGFSHRVEDMDVFFQAMAKGYDCVFGVRFGLSGSHFDGGFKRRFISRGGTFLSNLLLGTKLPDMTSGFEMFSHEALSSILSRGIQSRGPFFQTEIKAFAHQHRITVVPIRYNSPSHNVGGNALRDAFRTLWQLRKQLKKTQLHSSEESRP
ncbi:MAG: glycosyltransferase family 2 protein [Nitrospirae bacterium]|nr:glycosyltransferase family 2 protein [Magnetococcales bacterium]HAT51525.1 hypothetical protein [Alphaproteobacteria bacterium]